MDSSNPSAQNGAQQRGRWTRQMLIAWITATTGQGAILSVPRVFIPLAGDHASAFVLSQIVYWQDKTQDPDGWFYKKSDEWDAEIGVSDYQLTRALKKLEPLGVETKVARANGAPTRHFRLDWTQFLKSISEFLENRIPSFSEIETEETRESITSTTASLTASRRASRAADSGSAEEEDRSEPKGWHFEEYIREQLTKNGEDFERSYVRRYSGQATRMLKKFATDGRDPDRIYDYCDRVVSEWPRIRLSLGEAQTDVENGYTAGVPGAGNDDRTARGNAHKPTSNGSRTSAIETLPKNEQAERRTSQLREVFGDRAVDEEPTEDLRERLAEMRRDPNSPFFDREQYGDPDEEGEEHAG